MRKETTKALFLATVLGFSAITTSFAQIVVGNTGTSGNIGSTTGSISSSFDFDNDGEFLVVTLAAVSQNEIRGISEGLIDVTFNSVELTLAGFNRRSNDEFAAVWYLANPGVGEFSLAIDFQQDVFNGTNGTWQFGATSLSNVDESNPIAGSLATNIGTGDQTITPDTPGAFTSGDFLSVAVGAASSINGPHYTTDSGDQLTLWTGVPTGGAYSSIYQVLGVSDINGSGDVFLTGSGLGSSQSTVGIVFNQIPEPSTAALFGVLGLLALVTKRRRQ